MRVVSIELEGGSMPTLGTPHAASFDLYSPVSGIVYPGTTLKVPMGFRIEVPEGFAGIIAHRSGMNQHGILVYGTVDSDYRGIVAVTLANTSENAYRFSVGDRIAQMRFVEVPKVVLKRITNMSLETTRGEGGHGSTGL